MEKNKRKINYDKILGKIKLLTANIVKITKKKVLIKLKNKINNRIIILISVRRRGSSGGALNWNHALLHRREKLLAT